MANYRDPDGVGLEPSANVPFGTDANQAGTGAAGAVTLTMPAVTGALNLCTGFTITGGGATAATVVSATLVGLQGGTRTFKIAVPAGANAGISPIIVTFPRPIPASAKGQSIVLNVPNFGAGNTDVAATLDGYFVS